MINLLVDSLSILCTAFYLFLFVYLFLGWKKIPYFCAIQADSELLTRVAVIVAARNEQENIAHTISDLLAQEYPKQLLEIIIIDDHSSDDTSKIIASYADKGVQLIQLNENSALNSYKKKAIATAIDQTSATLIITTDADCRMGKHWLQTIVSYYQQGRYKMISSPVQYHQEQSFFETLQTLEFLSLIGLGAAAIGHQKATTCNGANLAYERAAFMQVGGFKGIDDLASGDDELLLHKMALQFPHQIAFLKNQEARVFTEAKPNLREFIQQRKRWASKSTKYKNKALVALGVSIWAFNVTILLNVMLSLWNIHFLYLAGLQILLKIAAETLFLTPLTRFANRRKLLWLSPILSIPHIFYMIYIGIIGNSGSYQWKGRQVR